MKQRKVYLVTKGEYSDYRVIAVFSSRYRAKKFGGGEQIEEYDLNPEYLTAPPGRQLWVVYMQRDGMPTNAYQKPAPIWLEDLDVIRVYRRSSGTLLYTAMWARDKEHAVKIANERRVQLIANGKWTG